jgi:ABC-type multidrug transport system fused ATPase/permease subunit
MGSAGLRRTLAYVWRLLPLYWSLLGRRKRSFLGLLGLALLGAVLDSLGIALVVPFLAALQGGGRPEWLARLPLEGDPIAIIAAAVGLVFLIKNVLAVLRMRWSLDVFYDLWREWMGAIFSSLLHAPMERVEKEKPGVLLAAVLTHSNESINALRHALELSLFGFTFFAIYAVLWALSWRATLAASVVMAVLALAVLRPLSGRAHRAGSRFVRSQQEASVATLEMLGGLRYLKTFRRVEAFEVKMSGYARELQQSLVAMVWASVLIHPLAETLVVCFFVGAAWLVSSRGAGAAASALPLLGALAAAAFRLFPILANLGGQWVGFISKEGSVLALRQALAPRGREQSGEANFERLQEAVVLDGVSFAYEGRAPALRNLTLRLGKGSRTALVGESGSGKSTVVGLVLGFLRPQSGWVRVDGRPLSELRLDSWRRELGYVGQDGFTFNTTIAMNVTLGRILDDDPRVLEVVDVVGLGELVKTLPEGMATVVGERGALLSGGQRQRLALARALLLKPSLLVLDEATSALDNESAAALLERVSRFLPGSTVLSVGHRLSHTRDFDVIYVLKAGRVVEEGSHSELIRRRGIYAGLFELESRSEIEPAAAGESLHQVSDQSG